MARGFVINGESLILVKGRADSGIGALSELGLTDGPILVKPDYRHMDIQVDAYGGEVPPEVQYKLAFATVTMSLVHFDPAILAICQMESQAGAPSEGQVGRAGALMGNGVARFAAGGTLGNHYIGVNITSPVIGRPWRFLTAYMTGPPLQYPLGTERSVVVVNWRAIPYQIDPYGGGVGAYGQYIYDRTLDT